MSDSQSDTLDTFDADTLAGAAFLAGVVYAQVVADAADAQRADRLRTASAELSKQIADSAVDTHDLAEAVAISPELAETLRPAVPEIAALRENLMLLAFANQSLQRAIESHA